MSDTHVRSRYARFDPSFGSRRRGAPGRERASSRNRLPSVGGIALAVLAVGVFGLSPAAWGQVTEILDASGDGTNSFATPDTDSLAVDGDGDVYVTGGVSDNAFRITPDGTVTQIINRSGDGAGNPLDAPQGIAAGPAGQVYLAGTGTDNVFAVDPDGLVSPSEILDSTGAGTGRRLDAPVGVAADGAGNVYVVGQGTNNVLKVTPAGVVTEIIDQNGDGAGRTLSSPVDVAVDDEGNVYVTGAASDNAFRITPGGVITQIIDGAGAGPGRRLRVPRAIAVADSGNVYVVGRDSDNVFEISPGGTIAEILGSSGDGAGNPLDLPQAVAVDPLGNVYVAAQRSNNAFKITPTGGITELIDSTGDGAGNPLSLPNSIAVADDGRVYVSGRGSHNVFRIEPACGNGVIDPGESCDDGNLSGGDCCSALCDYEPTGSACGDPTDSACDAADTCDGAGTCDANLAAAGASCGDPTDSACDAADTCDGAGACDANLAAVGVSCGDPTDSPCDAADTCDGAGACDANLAAVGTSCGDPTDSACDAADACDGAGACDANLAAVGTSCGDPTDSACDAADTCDGAGTCDANVAAVGMPCGDQGVECHADDACDGAGLCVDNGFAPAGAACGDSSISACDDADTCDGAGSCSPNPLPDGASCEDGDLCTQNEVCDSGQCVPESIGCDDGDLCTADICDPDVGCVYEGISLPLDTCETAFEKALFDVKETKAGKEKLTLKLLKGPALEQLDFGDPLDAGGTAYSLCVFDESGSLAGSLLVDAAGTDCGGKPCWKALGSLPPEGAGYLYKDRAGALDGVTLAKMKAGSPGKSLVQVKAKNNAAKGQTSLPAGIAAALAGSRHAVVAVLGDEGQCFAGAIDEVKKQDATRFKGQGEAACGDGVAGLLEECDGDDLGATTCESLGYAAGTLACGDDCRFDVGACFTPTCGDDSVNADEEECDGGDLAGLDCVDLGFAGGTLACDGTCSFDASGCDRRVFVTSTTFTGNLGGLDGGDALCQAHAESAGLGGAWTAWLSDATTDAADRITDARYVRVDGVVVATSLSDLLDAGLDAPIAVTESGQTDLGGNHWVWTGTRPDGSAESSLECDAWLGSDPLALGAVGDSSSTLLWTLDSSANCDETAHLYCFED